MNKQRGRIEQLRRAMAKHGIDVYMVMTEDFHSSEYVDDYFKGREWLSGFTGSAGTLLVSAHSAGLWTDGRYFLQAEEQLKDSGIELFRSGMPGVPSIPQFLRKHLKAGATLGYDGRTVSFSFGEAIKKELNGLSVNYKTHKDLLEEIWQDRPDFPKAPIWLLEEKYSGRSVESKLAQLREKVVEAGAEAILISSLDDIAWLYNYRGDDVLYTPVAMAYTLVTAEEAILYIAPEAVNEQVKEALSADGIVCRDYFAVYEDVKKHYSGEGAPKIIVDRAYVNEALLGSLSNPVFVDNPTAMAKAVKNPTEQENIRQAHIKDGVALTRTIYEIKDMVKKGTIGQETEISLEKRLTGHRAEQEDFISLSFSSIVGSGDHGAIVHYEATPESDRNIGEGFLLIDSGGQYLQGTTDVTRTLSIGKVTEEMRTHYTAVLMGNIDVDMAVFPKGTTGVHIDGFARRYLWDLGLDYNHGTGHGVGYLLNVHEGPNSIRKSSDAGGFGAAFEAGMVTSNEPAFYLEGRYGIRIENLLLSVESSTPGFMGFETLTMAPYDRAAIKVEMLNEKQRKRIDEYHAKVFETLAPYLSEDERNWLREETAAL